MTNPAPLQQQPELGELRGDRVRVRVLRLEDADTLFAAVVASKAELLPWLPWAAAYHSRDDALIFLRQMELSLNLEYSCGIWDAETGDLVGGVGLHLRDSQVPSFEIGYWLCTPSTGKGFMTQAVRLLATFAMEKLGAKRLFIRCDARNARSAAVARRVGFAYEGTFRHDGHTSDGGLRDTMFFSRLPEDGPFTS